MREFPYRRLETILTNRRVVQLTDTNQFHDPQAEAASLVGIDPDKVQAVVERSGAGHGQISLVRTFPELEGSQVSAVLVQERTFCRLSFGVGAPGELTVFSLKCGAQHYEEWRAHALLVKLMLQGLGAEVQAMPEGVGVPALISGIVYWQSAPDAKPYVKEGDLVAKGDTLCLLEAMKTFNEVVAPEDGRVVSLWQGDTPIEANQPICFIVPEAVA